MIKNSLRIAAAVLTFALLILSAYAVASGSGEVYSVSREMQETLSSRIDRDIIGISELSPETLTEVASLTLKDTYVRESVVRKTGGTLDGYYDHVRSTGFPDGYILTAETSIPLFDPGEYSEYVVGLIDISSPGGVSDAAFAENNYEGILLDDEIFDRDSGVVYVKKTDLYSHDGDEILTDYVQLQLLRAYRSDRTEIDIHIEAEDEAELIHNQSVYDPEIIINARSQDIDLTALFSGDPAIYVNGSGVALSPDLYTFEQGMLRIALSPANVFDLRICSRENDRGILSVIAESLFGSTDAYALSTSQNAITADAGVWIGTARIGDYVDFTAKGVNTKRGALRSYVQSVAGSAPGQEDFYDSLVEHDGQAAEDYVTGTYNGTKQNVYRSTYNADYGIDMSTADITDYSSEYMRDFILSISSVLQVSCIEVRKAVYRDFGRDPFLDFTAVVTAKGDDYIVLTFCSKQKTSSGSSNQVLCGTFAISYDPLKVTVSYDVNGGSWPGNDHILSSELVFGETHTVQTLSHGSEPKRTGFAFSGWSTSTEGPESYTGGEKIRISDSDKSSISLYASWIRADDTRVLWSEYGENSLFVSCDISDHTTVAVPVPARYRGSFDGYYICLGEDAAGLPVLGEKITDSSGKVLPGEIASVVSNGTFVNDGEIRLIAVFNSD